MIYDYILNLYTGNDDLRPLMKIPNAIDGFVYATDAHAVIRIIKHRLSFEYETNDKFPQADTMFAPDADNIYIFKTERLAKSLAKAKMVFLGGVCKKFAGKGEIYCNCCDNTNECKNCNGEGTVDRNSFRIAIDSDIICIKVGNKYFKPFLLEKLLITALALKEDSITIGNNGLDIKPTLFMVGDVEIIISPYYNSKEIDQDPAYEKI